MIRWILILLILILAIPLGWSATNAGDGNGRLKMTVAEAEQMLFKRYWTRGFLNGGFGMGGLVLANTDEYIGAFAVAGIPLENVIPRSVSEMVVMSWGLNILQQKSNPRGYWYMDGLVAMHGCWGITLGDLFGFPIKTSVGLELLYNPGMGTESLTDPTQMYYRTAPNFEVKGGIFFLYNLDTPYLASKLFYAAYDLLTPKDLHAAISAKLAGFEVGTFLKIKNAIELLTSGQQVGFTFSLPFVAKDLGPGKKHVLFGLDGSFENTYRLSFNSFDFGALSASFVNPDNWLGRVFLQALMVRVGVWWGPLTGFGGMIGWKDYYMTVPISVSLKFNEIEEDPVLGRNTGISLELVYGME